MLPPQPAPPGTLTAHGKSFLWLLHSCPDQIRRHPLRKTQTSMLLKKGDYTSFTKQMMPRIQIISVFIIFVNEAN